MDISGPACDKNGQFERIQCTTVGGVLVDCQCVDTATGVRNEAIERRVNGTLTCIEPPQKLKSKNRNIKQTLKRMILINKYFQLIVT